MDPFREVSRSQWADLRDLYQTNWPFGVEGYCFLDMLIKYPGITSSFNITVYCPGGDINKGMIALGNIESYHLYICPIVLENLSDLEEALLSTAVVDWNKEFIIIPSVNPEVMKVIDRIGEKLKMEVKCNGFVIKYLYSKDAALFTNIEPPPQSHVSSLKCKDLDIVDSTWTFHSPTSKQYFKRLMDNNLTYVLYSDDKPLAWVNVDETGALSHLYTHEGCRRQGYGAFITKTAVNDLLSKGQHVLTYALADNFTAQKLFVRLGFQNLGLTSWVFMTKKKSDPPSCSFGQVLDFTP